jgi:hypothetical protein
LANIILGWYSIDSDDDTPDTGLFGRPAITQIAFRPPATFDGALKAAAVRGGPPLSQAPAP